MAKQHRPLPTRPHIVGLVCVLLVGVVGCRHPAAVVTDPTAATNATTSVQRYPFARVIDAWCGPTGCTVLTPDGLVREGGERVRDVPAGSWTALERQDETWILTGGTPDGPCVLPLADDGTAGTCTPIPPVVWPTLDDPPDIASQATRFRAQWNAAIAARGRLGFTTILATPDGGVIALARGGDGRGQLFRTGGMPKMVPVPTAPSPATLPTPFAMHPSGTEAYLLSWPSAVLRALDPFTLATRWTVSLEGAGQGLFVDPSGRHLLAATGPEDDSRFANWPVAWPAPEDPCCADALLRATPRPPQDHVVVVDLATHLVAARAPGRYLRWFPGDTATWLVTDREVVRVPVPAPPG